MIFAAIKGFVLGHATKLIIGAGVLLVVGMFYLHYQHIKKENRILKENNAKLELAVETQQETIEFMKRDIESIKSTQKELTKKSAQYENDLDELRTKFTKNGRDFGKIAKQKPGLVEGIINKGTKDTFNCFEELSKNPEGATCE